MSEYEDDQEIGSCDDLFCDITYDPSDIEDHCPECGTCYAHCFGDHTVESIQALRKFMMEADDL